MTHSEILASSVTFGLGLFDSVQFCTKKVTR